jgi:hypothetical protein
MSKPGICILNPGRDREGERELGSRKLVVVGFDFDPACLLQFWA